MYYQNGKALVGAQTLSGAAYTIKKGDSFWKIAKEHNCNMYELGKINGKAVTSYIYEGEALKIQQ